MPSPESQNENAVALPFVGREQELADLEAAIASEEGQLILVVGPWQHGKSELLRALHRRNLEALRKSHSRFSLRYDLNRNDDSEAFLRCLRDDLLQIKGLTRRRLVQRVPARPEQIRGLMGAPFAVASAVPVFGKLADAGKELAQSLVPDANRLPREELLIVLNAVARKLSGDQRLVLIFDPQEYLHESCGPDWVSLCDRLPNRVKVVIAQRPDDNIVSYGPAITHPRIRRIPDSALKPLPKDAADELVEHAALHPATRFAALGSEGVDDLKGICWKRWAGHPLLLNLVLLALPLAPSNKQEILEAAAVAPRSFDELMQHRWNDVFALGDDAARVLRALAVVAAPTPLPAVASLLDATTDQVRKAVAQRAVQTLMKPRTPRSEDLEILHISCAEYILAPANTDVERKRDLHRRAAQMYADRLKVRPTDPQALVGVLRHLGDSGDQQSLLKAIPKFVPEMRRLRLWRPALQAIEQALGGDMRLPEAQRALLLGTGGNLLSHLGERAQARKHFQEALGIYRILAEAEPRPYLANVATILNNLGNLLSDLGERARAREHYEEALGIYRKLAEAEPGAYLPDLAMTLNNLGTLLGDLGQRAQARKHFEEALDIYRKLVEAEPGAYLPDVASALNNLGVLLSDLGERAQARKHFEEALGIYRILAEAEPGAYLAWVAGILNNLGALLSDLGERALARGHYEEALCIRRKLAEAEPGAYLPNVATTLNNLGLLLSDLDERAQARKHFEEALGIYRKLAQAEPGAYLANVAATLNNLGNLLSAVGERPEARKHYEEALSIRRDLAAAEPGAYLPDLAMALNNLGVLLSDLGERAQARRHYEEALCIRRKLAEAEPRAYLADVATTLNNLGNLLSDLGERTQAREHHDEALSIRRKLAEAEPGAYLPDLAMTLNNLGNLLSDLGERARARKHYEEALGICRKLAEAEPGAYLPNVAMTLNNLGNLLSQLGDPAQAREHYEEALKTYRKLAAAEPGAYLPYVAGTLNNLGNLLSHLGERALAREHYEEALAICRKLAQAEPQVFLERLRIVVQNAVPFAPESGISLDDWPALSEALALLKRLDDEAGRSSGEA